MKSPPIPKTSPLPPDMHTLGQQFRQAREEQGLTLSKAASLTRIKIQHLTDMEDDNFSRMPAPAYAKGFIRMYADLLGLDPVPLVEEYVHLHLQPPPPPPPPHTPPP
ncbi:MAG TPA: helix-turn-helix domain-containing protein, partial [Kiritimatiellia bacterium]|nr:helix-turn-helix domain-containing protein [Kiritimatiellia bacterium]